MPSFVARGTIKRSGVNFIIEAPNLDEAKQMAKRGQYEEYDDFGADTADWEIDPETVRPEVT